MAGRSKPTMRWPPISVTGTEVMSGSSRASISTYSMSFLSSQSIKAWQ